MSLTTLFCPGCNEWFGVDAARRECPQCSQTLASVIDAPTEDLSELRVREVIGVDRDPADDLVGTQLDRYFIESFLGREGHGTRLSREARHARATVRDQSPQPLGCGTRRGRRDTLLGRSPCCRRTGSSPRCDDPYARA